VSSAARKALRVVLTDPLRAMQLAGERLRAFVAIVSCRVRGVRLKTGRNLRVEGRLIVRGPGTVIIGDNVRIGGTVTPWTYRSGAVIEIGEESFINGASFGAWEQITIGRRCILGQCSIMDTDFHSVHVNRHDSDAPVRVRPVLLEENVWIGANVGILPGTSVGRDSVVGFGSVCSGTYPSGVIIAGNPARVLRPIEGTDTQP
jgi:carbonic anhydrase/acetyltransferase-like protein (isoleucine patch superfamily)